MKVALLFGSFNPTHNGHIYIGGKILKECDIDQVWYVITPHNPFKDESGLADENDRLEMMNLALQDYPNMKACDIEFDMDKPNYTYKTLRVLSQEYPDIEFSLVIGTDVLNKIHKWKNFEEVIEYPLITFIRNEDIKTDLNINNLTVLISDDNTSSTFVRNMINMGEKIDHLTNNDVANYIESKKLYQ